MFFTVTAKNSQGGAAKATCELPTYDTTPPGGRVTEGFISTSHPNIITASVLVIDDSVIIVGKVRYLMIMASILLANKDIGCVQKRN